MAVPTSKKEMNEAWEDFAKMVCKEAEQRFGNTITIGVIAINMVENLFDDDTDKAVGVTIFGRRAMLTDSVGEAIKDAVTEGIKEAKTANLKDKFKMPDLNDPQDVLRFCKENELFNGRGEIDKERLEDLFSRWERELEKTGWAK